MSLFFKRKIGFTQPSYERRHLTNVYKKPSAIFSKTIADCLKGDRASQNALYHALADKMYGVCMRYSRSANEAEEILQEGFIQMFAVLGQYRGEGSFEGWVRKIMVNTALQRFRKRSTLHAVIPLEISDNHIVSDEADVESHLGAKELLSMVQELPPAYRMVFNLYVFEGYQHKEIAAMLGVSEGTAKSNLHDARRWLRNKILREAAKDNLIKRYS